MNLINVNIDVNETVRGATSSVKGPRAATAALDAVRGGEAGTATPVTPSGTRSGDQRSGVNDLVSTTWINVYIYVDNVDVDNRFERIKNLTMAAPGIVSGGDHAGSRPTADATGKQEHRMSRADREAAGRADGLRDPAGQG